MTLPLVQSDEALAGTYVDLTTHLFQKRTLFIGPQITSQSSIAIAMQIMALAQEQAEINVFINCHGGHVPSGLAIVDMLEYAKSKGVPISTICLGECIGIATVILAAGKKRSAFRSARVSLYQEWYGMESIYGAMSQDDNERTRLMDLVVKRLVEYCPGIHSLKEDSAEFRDAEWDDFKKTFGLEKELDGIVKAESKSIRVPLDKIRVDDPRERPSRDDDRVAVNKEVHDAIHAKAAERKLHNHMGRLEFLSPEKSLQLELIHSIID